MRWNRLCLLVCELSERFVDTERCKRPSKILDVESKNAIRRIESGENDSAAFRNLNTLKTEFSSNLRETCFLFILDNKE